MWMRLRSPKMYGAISDSSNETDGRSGLRPPACRASRRLTWEFLDWVVPPRIPCADLFRGTRTHVTMRVWIRLPATGAHLYHILLPFPGLPTAGMAISLKTADEIDRMRVAGRLAAEVLAMIEPHVAPGDHHQRARRHLSPVHRRRSEGDPGTAQLPRLSEVHLHLGQSRGVPRHSRRPPAQAGRHHHIDITVIKDGYHGDTSRMFFVGKPPVIAERVTRISRECLWRGNRPGAPRDAGSATSGT